MNPIDLLTELDKERIESYISTFAGGPLHDRCSVEHYLRFWNSAKGEHLLDFFGGDKLITTVPIEYSQGNSELMDIIDEKLYAIDSATAAFANKLENIYFHYTDSWYNVRNLLSPDVLARNSWTFSSPYISFELPGGKTYSVNSGVKPMKVIKKLATAYGIEGFENFCNVHSQCLNQKKLKGILCLSIHPMDYMTMSDNASDWETCMSWSHDGQYKQGTVEMMNSPNVVVGYLKSDYDYKWGWGLSANGVNKWNDKRWRCLFIVEKDYIISVKEYPYENTFLVQQCVEVLAQLRGWNVPTYEFRESYHNKYENRTVCISCETGAMYNDFGSTRHYIALNPALPTDVGYYDTCCYSGMSECVWCGGIDEIGEQDNESCLVCDHCDPKPRCSCCGDMVTRNPDYQYWVHDTLVCEYCWENETACCPIEGTIWNDSAVTIKLHNGGDSLDEEPYAFRECQVSRDVWERYPKAWSDYVKIPEPHPVDPDDDEVFFLMPDELTDRGLADFFNIYDQDDLNNYLNS